MHFPSSPDLAASLFIYSFTDSPIYDPFHLPRCPLAQRQPQF